MQFFPTCEGTNDQTWCTNLSYKKARPFDNTRVFFFPQRPSPPHKSHPDLSLSETSLTNSVNRICPANSVWIFLRPAYTLHDIKKGVAFCVLCPFPCFYCTFQIDLRDRTMEMMLIDLYIFQGGPGVTFFSPFDFWFLKYRWRGLDYVGKALDRTLLYSQMPINIWG